MNKYILLALLGITSGAWAQKVAIKRVEMAGEKIIVHYDLEDSNPNNEYQISLYSSQSNFATALSKVSGDVGNEVKPGSNRKIVWNVKEEIGPYKGKLSLEIRGRMYVPVAKFTNITSGTKFKKGKNYTITWKPGNTNPINLELLNGGQRIVGEINLPNNGNHMIFIPNTVSKGKGYIIRITDSKNSQDVALSQAFAITPKLPFAVKALGGLVGIGAIAFLASQIGGSGGETPTEAEIPLPPVLPN